MATDTATLEEMQAERRHLGKIAYDQEKYVAKLRSAVKVAVTGVTAEAVSLEERSLSEMRASVDDLDTRIRQARYAAIASQVGITPGQVAEVATMLERMR